MFARSGAFARALVGPFGTARASASSVSRHILQTCYVGNRYSGGGHSKNLLPSLLLPPRASTLSVRNVRSAAAAASSAALDLWAPLLRPAPRVEAKAFSPEDGAAFRVQADILAAEQAVSGKREQTPRRPSSIADIVDLLQLQPREIVELACAALLAVGGAAVGIHTTRLLSQVLQDGGARRALVVQLLVAEVVKAVVELSSRVLIRVAFLNAQERIQQRLFRVMLAQRVAFFDAASTGELTSRFSDDVKGVCTAAKNAYERTIRCSVTALGSVWGCLSLSRGLTGVVVALLPLLWMGTGAATAGFAPYARELQEQRAETAGFIEEHLGNVRTVKAFGGEGAAAADLCARSSASFRLQRALAAAAQAVRAAAELGVSAGFAGVLLISRCSATLVITDGPSATEFFMHSMRLTESVSTAALTLLGELRRAAAASARLRDLLDTPPTLLELPGADDGDAHDPRIHEGSIRFADVEFAYPTRPRAVVLRGFSLAVPAGKRVALVGQSGGGKSTVWQLLERFYEPTSGSISVDGHDVRSLSIGSLRRAIGVVSQEPVLFAGTIRENVAYGSGGASDADVERALRAAQAWDFVHKLPDGLDTKIGERGVSLSIGQKQRLAIARCFVRDPKIVILDEATSALDSHAERAVSDALDELCRGRTVLIIAHRLRTVDNADAVAVVDHGRVVEFGQPSELLADPSSRFRAMRAALADSA